MYIVKRKGNFAKQMKEILDKHHHEGCTIIQEYTAPNKPNKKITYRHSANSNYVEVIKE